EPLTATVSQHAHGTSSSTRIACSIALISTSSPSAPTLFPYTTLFRSRRGFRPRVPELSAAGGRGHAARRRRRRRRAAWPRPPARSEEHTSELQSRVELVCRLLLSKKNRSIIQQYSSPSAC